MTHGMRRDRFRNFRKAAGFKAHLRNRGRSDVLARRARLVSIQVPNEFVISKLECREANLYSSGGCFSSAISGGPVSLSATRPARLGVGVRYGRDPPGRTRS